MKTLGSRLRQLSTGLCKIAKGGKPGRLVIAVIAVLFLCVFLFGLIIVSVSSLYQTSSTISSVGTFKAVGIGVYWNADSTRNVEALDWGYLTPGSQKSFKVYVSNEGVLPLTLSISTSNWNPREASDHLTLAWNYNGEKVNGGTTLPVTITLTVSGDVSGVDTFNFDVTAMGTVAN
jgi:uncharacterized membrane protein